MKHYKRLAALVAVTAMILAAVAASPASAKGESGAAAAQQVHGDEAIRFTVDPSAEGPASPAGSTSDGAASFSWPWTDCEHEGRADHPHKSQGQASVHGFWVVLDDDEEDCPDKADVWVELWAYGCGEISGECGYVKITRSPTKRIAPGGGRGKRATARHTCASVTAVTWIGRVDVDIPNEIDGSEKWWGPKNELSCSPTWPS